MVPSATTFTIVKPSETSSDVHGSDGESGLDIGGITHDEDSKESLKREQFYATVRKNSPRRDSTGLERIPGWLSIFYLI